MNNRIHILYTSLQCKIYKPTLSHSHFILPTSSITHNILFPFYSLLHHSYLSSTCILPLLNHPLPSMADVCLSPDLGAAGRPTVTYLINKASRPDTQHNHEPLTMAAPSRPTVQVNGLPSVSEDSPLVTPASERDKVKLNMLRRIRPPPFKYAWTFYHDKHSASADYEGRLTTMLEDIITIKHFWELFNQFPLAALKMKDSVHFFKRGVTPVWEDDRNSNGGSWTFRIPKAQSEEFWKEILLLAVGEQFADVIQARKPSPHF